VAIGVPTSEDDSLPTTFDAVNFEIQSPPNDAFSLTPAPQHTSDQQPTDYTSSIQDRFWAEYHRADYFGQNLFADSDGDGSNPIPPLRESLRLFPRTRTSDEKAQALAHAFSVCANRNVSKAEGWSDWSGQVIHCMDHVPRRIGFDTDLPNAILDRFC
jgi:hypothetical protein